MKKFKTKSKFNLLAAIMVPLLFVACGKDDNDATKPTTNNAPFTFLKVGNEWTYGVFYNTGELLTAATFKILVLL